MRFARIAPALLLVASTLIAASLPAVAAPVKRLDRVKHILVIYLENHSFDNMFGLFPGADGLIGKHAMWVAQIDADGKPFASLPPVTNAYIKPPGPDARFPADLPNKPFLIDKYMRQDEKSPDLVHRFYQNQIQIDGGKNDKFALISDARGLSMGYYDTRKTKLWHLAAEYTLADHFFMGAFGGSFLNHQWIICACAPRFDNAPDAVTAKLDDKGNMVKDGAVTPDGYAVNTVFSVFQPHPAGVDKANLLPPQTMPTIGDRLSDKGVSWAWYSGGWNDAIAGDAAKMTSNVFQFHHQPFAYYAKYGDGTEGRAQHLKDETDLYAAISDATLPAVAFYKPVGVENQHPGYANITNADTRAADVVEKLSHSALWPSTVVILTYDENGGFWDHVPPPKGDRWGPGTRIPTLILGPLARRHFVDHTVYDTSSILKLIETRFGLQPLGTRDAAARDMTNALALGKK